VFIYFDHGDEKRLGPDNASCDVDFFADLASIPLSEGCPILFVLGACYSRPFAQAVWDRLAGGKATQQVLEAMPSCLGFLTSAPGNALTSAIVLSGEEELVYMITPGEKEGNFALGFRISNSMFGRQLLPLWTYLLAADNAVTFKDFPALLNHQDEFPDRADDPFVNGFDSAFLGGEAFGNYEVRSFLPFALLSPDAPVPGLPGTTYAQVIPAERIGRLFEDMTRYTYPGASARDLEGTFVEIAKVGDQIDVVGLAPRSWAELGWTSKIVQEIGGATVTGGTAPKPKVKLPMKVPWMDFFVAMQELRVEKKWSPGFADPLPWDRIKVARQFLKGINGKVPHCWPFITRFAEWLEMHERISEEAGNEFKELVRDVFKRLEGRTARPASTYALLPSAPDGE
jgi:hypothetical protein